MAVREDCRHYIERSATALERVQRCRIDVALLDPFACPSDCLFFEPRRIDDAGWQVELGRRPDE